MARMLVTLELDTDATVAEMRNFSWWNDVIDGAAVDGVRVLQASAMRAKGIETREASAAKKGKR